MVDEVCELTNFTRRVVYRAVDHPMSLDSVPVEPVVEDDPSTHLLAVEDRSEAAAELELGPVRYPLASSESVPWTMVEHLDGIPAKDTARRWGYSVNNVLTQRTNARRNLCKWVDQAKAKEAGPS